MIVFSFLFSGMPLPGKKKARAPRKQKGGILISCLLNIDVFLVPLARTKFEDVSFLITNFIFDVKDQKLCANSHWISVVLNSDGYSFKSSGSTTRSSTRYRNG